MFNLFDTLIYTDTSPKDGVGAGVSSLTYSVFPKYWQYEKPVISKTKSFGLNPNFTKCKRSL